MDTEQHKAFADFHLEVSAKNYQPCIDLKKDISHLR